MLCSLICSHLVDQPVSNLVKRKVAVCGFDDFDETISCASHYVEENMLRNGLLL